MSRLTGSKLDFGSVEVTADGTKTWQQLLNELVNLVDSSKITQNTKLVYDYNTTSGQRGENVFDLRSVDVAPSLLLIIFQGSHVYNTYGVLNQLTLSKALGDCSYKYYNTQTNAVANNNDTVITSDKKLRIVY